MLCGFELLALNDICSKKGKNGHAAIVEVSSLCMTVPVLNVETRRNKAREKI